MVLVVVLERHTLAQMQAQRHNRTMHRVCHVRWSANLCSRRASVPQQSLAIRAAVHITAHSGQQPPSCTAHLHIEELVLPVGLGIATKGALTRVHVPTLPTNSMGTRIIIHGCHRLHGRMMDTVFPQVIQEDLPSLSSRELVPLHAPTRRLFEHLLLPEGREAVVRAAFCGCLRPSTH